MNATLCRSGYVETFSNLNPVLQKCRGGGLLKICVHFSIRMHSKLEEKESRQRRQKEI
jgi:hypothetical protein